MEPKILCPQVIHNHLDCPILRTAKNPVVRRHIEQANGTIVLLREYETRIVSVTVNALPNRFSLRGLSHFHLSLFLSLISTLYHGFFRVQEKSGNFCVKRF
jgi:hypothetical protein